MWWKEHQTDFPILIYIVFYIFLILAISSKVEYMFLAAKRLIIDKRNYLGAEVIEASEC